MDRRQLDRVFVTIASLVAAPPKSYHRGHDAADCHAIRDQAAKTRRPSAIGGIPVGVCLLRPCRADHRRPGGDEGRQCARARQFPRPRHHDQGLQGHGPGEVVRGQIPGIQNQGPSRPQIDSMGAAVVLQRPGGIRRIVGLPLQQSAMAPILAHQRQDRGTPVGDGGRRRGSGLVHGAATGHGAGQGTLCGGLAQSRRQEGRRPGHRHAARCLDQRRFLQGRRKTLHGPPRQTSSHVGSYRPP